MLKILEFQIEPIETRKPQPEILLLKAMLLRAYLDAVALTTEVTLRQQRIAKAWFRSNSNAPFSFKWTCDVLEIEKNIHCSKLLKELYEN